MAATNRSAVGYVVPQAIGNESILQTVLVNSGDAKTIAATEKNVLGLYTDLLGNMPGAIKMKMEPQPAKTINGVTMEAFRMSVQADANDPTAVQAQQMMAMFYGPNGLMTHFGVVDPKTFLMVQGGSEKLLNDAVAAAKGGSNPLGQNAVVQGVASQLPKQRFSESYIALDNIVSTALKYAQMFGLPVRVKVPANLPPLGISIANDGSALRGDLFIPSQTVQSLISAGLQGYQQMQGGPKGGV
jgi:hypothetical protein